MWKKGIASVVTRGVRVARQMIFIVYFHILINLGTSLMVFGTFVEKGLDTFLRERGASRYESPHLALFESLIPAA
jgi:hypothetical protein